MSRLVDIKGFTYEIRKIILYRPESIFDSDGWSFEIDPNLIPLNNDFWKMINATKLKFKLKLKYDFNDIFVVKGFTSKMGHQTIRTAKLHIPYALLNFEVSYETKRFGFIRETWSVHTSRTYNFSFREKVVLTEKVPAWEEEAIQAATKYLRFKALCKRLFAREDKLERMVEYLDPERTIRDAHEKVKNILLDENE